MTPISQTPHKTVLKTVAVQEYPGDHLPRIYHNVTSYEYTELGEYTFFVVRGEKFEAYIPVSNIIHIDVVDE